MALCEVRAGLMLFDFRYRERYEVREREGLWHCVRFGLV